MGIALAALVLLPGLGLAARRHPTDLWLHVSVHEQDAEAKVLVTLPLGLVEGVLPLLQGDKVARGRIQVSDIDGSDLRRAWDLAHSAPEGTFIDIPTDGEGTLAVARLDGRLVFRADDDNSRVRVRMPLEVAEKLLQASDREQAEFDLAGLVRALRTFGPGELVAAEDGESRIRIWIDRNHGDDD
jgi:hypothetical protein